MGELKVTIRFQCRCGESRPEGFIFRDSPTGEKRAFILCLTCERKYAIEVRSKEVK